MIGRLRRIPFEVVAAKPLVESDRAVELMDAAAPVKAVWMLRHYRGVAQSSLRRFGESNSFEDLQPFCDPTRWTGGPEVPSRETRETVTELMHEGLAPLDAAALFWWARNQLYFEQQLWRDERIRIIRYERRLQQLSRNSGSARRYIDIPLPQRLDRRQSAFGA